MRSPGCQSQLLTAWTSLVTPKELESLLPEASDHSPAVRHWYWLCNPLVGLAPSECSIQEATIAAVPDGKADWAKRNVSHTPDCGEEHNFQRKARIRRGESRRLSRDAVSFASSSDIFRGNSSRQNKPLPMRGCAPSVVSCTSSCASALWFQTAHCASRQRASHLAPL